MTKNVLRVFPQGFRPIFLGFFQPANFFRLPGQRWESPGVRRRWWGWVIPITAQKWLAIPLRLEIHLSNHHFWYVKFRRWIGCIYIYRCNVPQDPKTCYFSSLVLSLDPRCKNSTARSLEQGCVDRDPIHNKNASFASHIFLQKNTQGFLFFEDLDREQKNSRKAQKHLWAWNHNFSKFLFIVFLEECGNHVKRYFCFELRPFVRMRPKCVTRTLSIS